VTFASESKRNEGLPDRGSASGRVALGTALLGLPQIQTRGLTASGSSSHDWAELLIRQLTTRALGVRTSASSAETLSTSNTGAATPRRPAPGSYPTNTRWELAITAERPLNGTDQRPTPGPGGRARGLPREARCHLRLGSRDNLRPHQTEARPAMPPGTGPGHRDATEVAPESRKLDPTRPRMSRRHLSGRPFSGEIMKNLMRSA
jgi:hypothetical protein